MALSRSNIQARLAAAFTGRQAEVLADLFIAVQEDAVTVNTGVEILAAKLNADATVTDTDYAAATIPTTGI